MDKKRRKSEAKRRRRAIFINVKDKIHEKWRLSNIGKLVGIFTGRNQPVLMRIIFSSHTVAFLLALLAFLLAATISFFADEIKLGSENFLNVLGTCDVDNYSINIKVLCFWLGTLLWSTSLYFRLIYESQQHIDIIGEIRGSPNPEWIYNYPQMIQTLDELENQSETWDEFLLATLGLICEFTRYFSGQPYAKISANIMFPLDPSKLEENKYNVVKEIVKFRFSEEENIREFERLLVMDQEFMYSDGSDYGSTQSFSLKPIALPVRKNDKDPYGNSINLPGAVMAYKTHKMAIYSDVMNIVTDLGEISSTVRNELYYYFDSDDGRELSSFISVPILLKDEVIAILNINSDKKFIVGSTKVHYYLFKAIMEPVYNKITTNCGAGIQSWTPKINEEE